jgi:hypothetical protein
MRYIEPNPVRAGLVVVLADCAWSGYQGNAMDKACGMLKPHENYHLPGATPPVRQLAYCELFRQAPDPALVYRCAGGGADRNPAGQRTGSGNKSSKPCGAVLGVLIAAGR